MSKSINKPAYRLVDNGDSAITVLFEQAISEALSVKIIQLAGLLQKAFPVLIVELIPAYQSLTIMYRTSGLEECTSIKNKLLKHIKNCLVKVETVETVETDELMAPLHNRKVIEIPVCYQTKYAPDLPFIAEQAGLTTTEVIKRHTTPKYLVHMLGFLPGFLYLGGLDKQLHCARKAIPALRIQAGSVAIGGSQTGVYPVNSPGGWHIIGRTPVSLFNVNNQLENSFKNTLANNKEESQDMFIASPLDRVQFVSITEKEFDAIIALNGEINGGSN